MLHTTLARIEDQPSIELELDPQGRAHRLRENYWAGTYRQAVAHKAIAGCGDRSFYAPGAGSLRLFADPQPAQGLAPPTGDCRQQGDGKAAA